MQFYMISPDPAISAQHLPDAALKVNVREGWQMISDIAHSLGLVFKGQNEAYSPNHATTMRLRESRAEWERFMAHYRECLSEWRRRFKSTTVWHECWEFVPRAKISARLASADRFTTCAHYIATTKIRDPEERERFVEQNSSLFDAKGI